MTYISDIDVNTPAFNADVGDGDDQIRELKSDIITTLPNLTGEVTADQDDINLLTGATLVVSDVTATAAEINDHSGDITDLQSDKLNDSGTKQLDGTTTVTGTMNHQGDLQMDGVSLLPMIAAVSSTGATRNFHKNVSSLTDGGAGVGLSRRIHINLSVNASASSNVLMAVGTGSGVASFPLSFLKSVQIDTNTVAVDVYYEHTGATPVFADCDLTVMICDIGR